LGALGWVLNWSRMVEVSSGDTLKSLVYSLLLQFIFLILNRQSGTSALAF
jgi:hypothetical protein